MIAPSEVTAFDQFKTSHSTSTHKNLLDFRKNQSNWKYDNKQAEKTDRGTISVPLAESSLAELN
jgi:hypothetical protein